MPLFFAFASNLRNSIITWDEKNGVKEFENDDLDFKKTSKLVVMKNLYVFEWGSPVTVYKIATFSSPDLKTTLSTLYFDEFFKSFAVSDVAGSVILTGGANNAYVWFAQTFMIDLQTGM